MKKNCFKKVQKCFKANVHLITCYETKKGTAIFCSAKDSIPIHQKTKVIYKVTCPGCNEDYVGKTDRNLITRLNEMLPMKINLCISTYRNVNTLHILLIYTDYQTLMLQQQRSITNDILLTLLFLTSVFWTHAVTGPNCYFQKHCTSKSCT